MLLMLLLVLSSVDRFCLTSLHFGILLKRKPFFPFTMSKSALTRVPAILVLFMAITMVLGLMVAVLLWSNGISPKQDVFAKPGPYDNRIVPGYRAGFITLNMSASTLEPTLGEASIRPQDGSILYLFKKYQINVSVSKNKVTSIFVTNPNFVLGIINDKNVEICKQIKVGSDIENALRIFGDNYEAETKGQRTSESLSDLGQRYTLHYWEQGVHFGVQEHKITYIMVTTPIIDNHLDSKLLP